MRTTQTHTAFLGKGTKEAAGQHHIRRAATCLASRKPNDPQIEPEGFPELPTAGLTNQA